MIRLILVMAIVGGCSRIGDDRFAKVPDAAVSDAVDVTPDAAGPPDAPSLLDAGVDAAPDAS